jgi:hypothetical protein
MYDCMLKSKYTFLQKFIQQSVSKSNWWRFIMALNEGTPLLKGIDGAGDDGDELTGCGGTVCCNPRRSLHRYLVLIIMCFLSFGEHFHSLSSLSPATGTDWRAKHDS